MTAPVPKIEWEKNKMNYQEWEDCYSLHIHSVIELIKDYREKHNIEDILDCDNAFPTLIYMIYNKSTRYKEKYI